MTLPVTGALSLGMANTELGKASNTVISLNDTNIRTLANKSSGQISLADLRGKSAIQGSRSFNVTPGYLGGDGIGYTADNHDIGYTGGTVQPSPALLPSGSRITSIIDYPGYYSFIVTVDGQHLTEFNAIKINGITYLIQPENINYSSAFYFRTRYLIDVGGFFTIGQSKTIELLSL